MSSLSRQRGFRVRGRQDGTVLPLTSYATLGLLNSAEELTAIDVEHRAHQYLRFFYWAPALSHIRRELNRLEDLGYASSREVLVGRVKRTLKYRMTAAGEQALARWAENSMLEPTVKKNPALLRLWLGRRAGDSAAILAGFEEYIAFLETEREELHAFVGTNERILRERSAALEDPEVAVTLPEDEERAALTRMSWHLAVMRYCLRDYEADVRNARRLVDEFNELGLG